MKLHSDYLDSKQIRDAFNAERTAGRIADGVDLDVSTVGSRTHGAGFLVKLSIPGYDGPGRHLPMGYARRTNSGTYGAGYDYAATYDEWGFFLSALYRIDHRMVVGTVKTPTYDGREDFDERTGWSYDLDLADTIRDYGDPAPYVRRGRGVGKRGMIGKGRANGYPSWLADLYDKLPRSVEDVRAFHHLDAATAAL